MCSKTLVRPGAIDSSPPSPDDPWYDLPAVPDMSHFYEQHKSVQPYLITKEGADTSVENLQSKEERAQLDGAPHPPSARY